MKDDPKPDIDSLNFENAREAILPALRESIREHGKNLTPELQNSLASLGATMIARQAIDEQTTVSPQSKATKKSQNINPVQLDFWGEDFRAAPNAVLRSSLFPALSLQEKESRQFLKKENIFCVAGIKITFTGEQFDQSDLDVYLELLRMAQPFALGTPIKFSAHSLLKSLGLGTGGKDHKRLHEVLTRLCGGVLDIADHKKKYFGQLLYGGTRDEINMNYTVKINPDFAVLFGFGMYAKIDIDIRRSLGRNPTAKSLHAYYSSHINPTAHKFETLANITGVSGKNKKTTLIKAHEAMKKVEFLNNYEVQDDSIKADINHSPSQNRAIIKKETASKLKRKKPKPE